MAQAIKGFFDAFKQLFAGVFGFFTALVALLARLLLGFVVVKRLAAIEHRLMKALLLLHAWRLVQLFPLPFKVAKAAAIEGFPRRTGVLL